MTRKQHRILRGIFIVIIVFCICLPGIVYGEEPESNFVLTGVHTDGFYLTSNNQQIFHAEGVLPGDTIHAVIEAENISDETLDLALVSVDSLLYDTSLFDAMHLSIAYDGVVLYEGPLHTDNAMMTDYIPVHAGERIALDVTVTIPQDLDNTYQGSAMESVWVFEAKHYGNDNVHSIATSPSDTSENGEQTHGVKTGAELPGYDYRAVIFAVIGVVFISLGLYLMLKPVKKEN